MPAYTGDEALLHLTKLYKAAYDLIEKQNGRKWYETDALFKAMQCYKDEMLGWIEPKLSVEEHRRMFSEAMRGSRRAYEHLLDSLREFGLDNKTIQKLKAYQAQTLLELGQMPLKDLFEIVSHLHHPWEHIVPNAFRQVQKKIGIEKPVHFLALSREEKERLQEFAETYYSGPPQI